MERLIVIAALISSVMSSCISLLYAYIAYKKSKEPPNDEIWETATKIICSDGGMKDSDGFARLYEELKFFKDNGYSMDGINSLSYAVRERNKDTEKVK